MKEDHDRRIATLALRAEMITSDQWELVMGAWSSDRTTSMGEVLESRKLVDAAGRAHLERLAAREEVEGGSRATPPPGNTTRKSSPSQDGPDEADAPSSPRTAPLDEYATIASGSASPVVGSSSSGPVRLASLGDSGSGETRTRYTRTQFHARGGVGQVWLARDGELGREVALKELRPEQGTSPEAWSRFVDEARITGQLEHPGIVPVYELSVRPEEGDPFYTMRFIRGKTLNRAVRDYHEKKNLGQSGPLDLASLLTAFVSLCNTVGYAHSRGVIHRDLKGQNVVLGDFGEVMLLDWGIAKLVGQAGPTEGGVSTPGMLALHGNDGSARAATIQGQVFGTPFYMAPEQAEGRTGAIDARTDVYGLGAILYEILAGKAPYQGHDTGEVLRKVSEEPPVSPRLVNPEAARALEAVCLQAMSKRPEDRYPSALALAEEVRRWLADEPISAYREPWTVRLARFSKRHRTAATSAAALLVAAVVALTVSSVLIGRERDEARRQRQQARKAVDDNYTRVAEEWLADRLDPLQREFLEKALAYYRDFAGPDEGEPGLRQERGRAHLRMGDVLRKLGRHDEAEPAYRRSIEILSRLATDQPAVAGYRDQLAEATYRLGSERAARGKAVDLDEAAQLLRRAASTQEALLAETPATSRRVALGRTLDALADLLRVTGRAEESEATYRRSIALLERAATDEPGEVPPRQELGVALDGLAFLLKERGKINEAMAPVRQAVQVFEKLVAEAPTLPAPKDGLAKAYNSLSLLLRDAGTPAEAEVALDKEVALNRRLVEDYPVRPEYRRTLARVLINLGIIYRETNRTREADAAYSEALKLNEKLAAEFPEVRKYARDQAHCLNNLAELRAARKGDAEPLYRKALEINRALAAAAPGASEHRIDEAGVLQNLGTWLSSNGRGDESIEALQQAVALFDGVTAADTENPSIRRGMARSLNSLGSAFLAKGRHAEAEEAYRRAVNAYDLLVARPPVLQTDRLALAACLSNRGSNQTTARLAGADESLRRSLTLLDAMASEGPPSPDLRFRLAAARNNHGEWLAADGHPAEAEVAFRSSIDLFGGLATQFPKVLAYKSTLGQARANLGEFLVARQRPDDARTLLEQGISEERAALAAGPETRDSLRKHLTTLAALLLDRSAYVEVANVGEELLKVASSVPSVQPQVARLMARCVPMAAADTKVSAARRAIQAGAYADRAIALLREAIQGGGIDASQLLKDAIFDSIRERDGFKALEPEKIGHRRSADALDSAV